GGTGWKRGEKRGRCHCRQFSCFCQLSGARQSWRVSDAGATKASAFQAGRAGRRAGPIGSTEVPSEVLQRSLTRQRGGCCVVGSSLIAIESVIGCIDVQLDI